MEDLSLMEKNDEVHDGKSGMANPPVKKVVVGVGIVLAAGLLMMCVLGMGPEKQAAPNRAMLEWTGKSCVGTRFPRMFEQQLRKLEWFQKVCATFGSIVLQNLLQCWKKTEPEQLWVRKANV